MTTAVRSPAVSFRPESMRGASPGNGDIDYRLARASVISEFKKGRMSKVDVCDAHPELVRAARNIGTATTLDCPICEMAKLVLVTYAFGSRLPAHGRCITSAAELAKLRREPDEVACYVVEVCPDCSWNHLDRTFSVGGGKRRS